jgi:hypothetical protein
MKSHTNALHIYFLCKQGKKKWSKNIKLGSKGKCSFIGQMNARMICLFAHNQK